MITRRTFVKFAALLATRQVTGQTTKSVDTPVLRIAYEESGPAQGFPIILLHGFPDDVHAWDDVTPPLAKAGYSNTVVYSHASLLRSLQAIFGVRPYIGAGASANDFGDLFQPGSFR